MFEQIINMVKQEGAQLLGNNPAIPQEHHDAIINEATNAVNNQVQQMQQNGQTDELQQMVQNGQNIDANHPAVQQAQGNFITNITSKLGISPDMAKGIAVGLIPMIMGKLMNHNQSMGNSGGGLGGMFGGLAGRFGL